MSEVGKRAKRLGKVHPRVLRRIPCRDRAVANAQAHRVRRPFGFSYERAVRWWTPECTRWIRQYAWFATRAAASQAMGAFERRLERNEHEAMRQMYRDVRKEERTRSADSTHLQQK